MGTITHLLFDDPLGLYVLLGIVEIVLLVLWRRRRSRRAAIWLLAPLAVASLVFAVEALVVTRREKLVSTLEAMGVQARLLNVDGVAPFLAEDFRFADRRLPLNKDLTLREARRQIGRHAVESVVFKSHTIEIEGEKATVHVTAQILGGAEMMGMPNPVLDWPFTWRYGPEGEWTLIRADPPQAARHLTPIR